MPAPKTCSRPGCTKTLRINNSSGACATNCMSPDVPPSMRAGHAPGSREADTLARFRRMARLLGQDPDAILRAATMKVAAAWLEKLEAAVK